MLQKGSNDESICECAVIIWIMYQTTGNFSLDPLTNRFTSDQIDTVKQTNFATATQANDEMGPREDPNGE